MKNKILYVVSLENLPSNLTSYTHVLNETTDTMYEIGADGGLTEIKFNLFTL